RGIVGFIERVGAFGHRRYEFLRVSEAPVLGLVLGPLPRVEAERFEVADLVGEQIALARGGALRLLPRGALVGQLAPRGVARNDFAGSGLASAERIEQHPLAIALQ